MAKRIFTILALAAALCTSSAAQASRRVALVIGNAAYTDLPALTNSVNDSAAVRDTLRDAGFETFYGANLTRLQIEDLLRKFFRDVDDADIATIYYSGHGVQVAGDNFMVPVDAKLASPYDIEQQTFKIADIFHYLAAHSRAQVIFLDACRNNPFKTDRFWIGDTLKSAEKTGLARTALGVGSLIAFSTEPGAVAYDGNGTLSPYTTALIRHITAPNQEIRHALTLVRREVIAATDGLQVPWENSALTDDLFLTPAPPAPKVVPVARVAIAPNARSPLNLPAPTRASDDGLAIRFDQPPDRGRLLLDGKPLAPAQALSAADFQRLVFDAADLGVGQVAVMAYSVTDRWAQSAHGMAAVAIEASSPATNPARDAVAEADAALTRLNGRNAVATVAVGPVALRLDANVVESAPAISIARAPNLGVLRLGERTLSAHQQFAFADLSRLAYQPAVGAEGQKDSFTLAVAGARGGAATIALAPALDECDRQAASPLDLQGVGPGKLPNEIDAARAIAACENAVAAYPNVARFAYQLGRAKLAAGKTEDAKALIERAASAKHTRATWELGNLAAFGALGAADAVQANAFYKQCSDAGDAYCAYAYGRNLFYGRGVAADRRAGLNLMLRAAALGHTYAMNELGYIFLYGKGEPIDAERGIRFYEAGAERDDIYSLNNLGLVYLRGAGRPAQPAKALAFFTRAAAGGHPFAPFNLGRMARDGIGGPKDGRAATRWFELGADRGDYWSALERARLESDNVVAATFLALAVSLNRDDDNHDPDSLAEKALGKLPQADLQRALDKLSATLGSAAVADAPTLQARLIETQARAWRSRNPRFDLF